MNMRILLPIFFALFSSFSVLQAQAKVRIRVLDENDQPLRFVRLTLSGANLPVETQSNGEFSLEFPPGQDEIIFYPPGGFERISPPNGQLYLPEDKSRTLTIWLARKGNDNRDLEVFTKILSKKEQEKASLQAENETLKNQLSRLESDQKTTTALYDSLASVLQQNTGSTVDLEREIADLHAAVELKQQQFYKQIAGQLLIYADRLKDLRDALPRISDAFIDPRAMQGFEQIIEKYNTARDSVLQNYRGNVEIVRSLWGENSARDLDAVYDKTLVSVHQQLILPLNTSVLDQFRAVRAEEVRPAKARKNAQKSANETFAKLNAAIPDLETSVRASLAKLEALMR